MSDGSNLVPVSNVFVVNGDLRKDLLFRSKVRGRDNIQKMLTILMGSSLKTVFHRDFLEDWLTPSQMDEWELGLPCVKLPDKGEQVWGLVRKGDKTAVECRCYNTECSLFRKCRPDFDPRSPGPTVKSPTTLIIPGHADKEAQMDGASVSPSGNSYSSVSVDFDDVVPVGPLVPSHEWNSGPDTESESQVKHEIVCGNPSSKILVTAAPGSGKTHCLIERLRYMAGDMRLVEAEAVLVLCFTRAAVREVRERFLSAVKAGGYSDDFSRLEIRTFDSFATRVLLARQVEIADKDYNQRIEAVIQEIRKDPSILQEMRHFIVDEVQDLVGVRARLVRTILCNRPDECGFTLFGDPLQGIYDYQVKGIEGETDARALLEWVRESFRNELREVSLKSNRRQSCELANLSAESRELLESGNYAQLLHVLSALPDAGFEYRPQLPAGGSKAAILCRTNGEALRVSNNLRKLAIPHGIHNRNGHPLVPKWFGDLISLGLRTTASEMQAYFENSTETCPGWGRVFSALKLMGRTRGDVVDLAAIRSKLASGEQLPDDLYEANNCNSCVSTIHQAKGREYDTVLVLKPEKRQDWDPYEESKILYVALTRARTQLGVLKRSKSNNLLRKSASTKSGRWTEQKYDSRKGKWTLTGVEVGVDNDVDEQSFVDTAWIKDVAATQKYVSEKVHDGDPLEIRRLADGQDLTYGLFHNDMMVGLMSGGFSRDVRAVMKEVYGWSSHSPYRIVDIFVRSVFTCVRPPETLRASVGGPWSELGVWYSVFPVGLGLIHWSFN